MSVKVIRSTADIVLLRVGSGRRLVELDDHVDRGAVMAAFDSVEVFGQLMLLAVGKRSSGSQQSNQGQEREPPAPSRCLQEWITGGFLRSRRIGRMHELNSSAKLRALVGDIARRFHRRSRNQRPVSLPD